MAVDPKKVILIVGASSGFGELVARKLLAQGHTVYAAARRVERMAGLEKLGAKTLAMDVTQNDSVVAGAGRVIEEQGRIDVVFANAGFGSYGMIEAIPMEDVQYQFDVNVFGVARTIRAVLPQMRKQRSGRIIITASLVSHLSGAGFGWYAATKHAVAAMADALRQETRAFGIDVVLIEPGIVQTEFDTVALGALARVEHPDDYRPLVKGFRQRMADSYAKGPGPESTAQAMLKAATARRPKTRYRTTLDARLLPAVRRMVGDRFFDMVFLSDITKAAKKAGQKH